MGFEDISRLGKDNLVSKTILRGKHRRRGVGVLVPRFSETVGVSEVGGRIWAYLMQAWTCQSHPLAPRAMFYVMPRLQKRIREPIPSQGFEAHCR